MRKHKKKNSNVNKPSDNDDDYIDDKQAEYDTCMEILHEMGVPFDEDGEPCGISGY